MTKGNIIKGILLFALPLVIGNILQQLYSTIDSIICGNYIGSTALASIGTSEPIINLLTGAFFGFATGVSILVAQYVGANDTKKQEAIIYNGIAQTFVLGIIITIVSIFGLDMILKTIHTPSDVYTSTKTYLSIYFMGITPVLLYNMIAGILRGMGNSKVPLYFLAVTSVINVLLDLLFIIIFKMGIVGAALATIIAQSISAILALLYLYKLPIQFSLKKLCITKDIQLEIIKLGIPTAMGAIIIDFSNVTVQSFINGFGKDAMAGINTYFRFDLFMLMPSKSFGYAIETFVAQNLGAKQFDRIYKGIKATLLLALSYIIFVSTLAYFFGHHSLYAFNQEPNVLYYGNYMLKHFVWFYPFLTMNHVFCGVLRGAKRTLATNVINIISMCILRLCILFIGFSLTDSIIIIVFGYTFTWIFSGFATMIYTKLSNFIEPYKMA